MKKLFAFLILTSCTFAQLDSVSNFAQAQLSTGISSSATTIILSTGQGDRFPISGYNLTLWDFGRYGTNINAAYRANRAEIIRVTARSGDTLTVSRAQEGTTARAFNTTNGVYYVAQIITKKMITDIGTQFSAQDSVDIPLVFALPSNYAAGTINYAALGGATGFGTAESSVPYTPIGINGLIKGFYLQAKTNTITSTTVTLQYGDSAASSLTTTGISLTLAGGTKAGSVTGKSFSVLPRNLLGLKFDGSGGSSMTLIGITLIIRTALN